MDPRQHEVGNMTSLRSEAQVLAQVRLDAGRQGITLYRNNVGMAYDSSGRAIRYGLLNESSRVNQIMKSSDLIGITPVIITQEMVGRTLGVFTAVEVKREGWGYKGTDREVAQKAFLDLVISMGGIGRFENGSR